ncbi:hypothetical protein M413DRAFT_423691 [Hebeloma cylindrosporum]|uniref:F-box domain-containing protein n=1 Tax=Hebeloma cylindrosporum TaxID=76867 RepID=A0A0C3BYS7_HEBCY|nr:hypothetical protein M413DRAFT_423691 [Hebeloma cylindrosporum h7]
MTAQTSTSIVKEADLRRFEFYASRIRRLQLSSFTENTSSHIYMAIATAFQGKALFPALKHVEIFSLNDISNENFLFLHLTAPSPLSKVEISGVTKSNAIRLTSFINDTACHHRSRSTNLHPLSALSLEGSFLPPIANQLSDFTRLAELTFSPTVAQTNMLREILEMSSSLLSLLQFKLELPRDESEELRINLSRESKLYTFPALQNLEVVGPARHVCDVLHSIYGAYLSSITFTISPPVYETEHKVPKCIRRCTTMTPTLLHLRINLPEHWIHMDDNLFRPFQNYRLLRSLHICSLGLTQPHLVDLFDKKFGEWPLLESVILELANGYQSCERDQTAPIRLPAFSCPKLRRLESYLNLPDSLFGQNTRVNYGVSLQDLLDSSEKTNHILTELKIAFFELDYPHSFPSVDPYVFMEAKEPILLARAIDRLYPNLKRLDICGDSSYPFWKPWYRGIEMMVKNFREARGA